jgi:hypothetical protein
MMRIKGKSTRFLIEFLIDEVGTGQTTAYEILRDAQKVVTEMQERHIEDAYSDAIARLEELYETSSDKKTKLQIQQELNKLQGLYKPNKVDVTTNGKDLQINEIVVKFVDSKNDIDE